MLNSTDVQAAMLLHLKGEAAITALVPAAEIREAYWQGAEFTYPNVRVTLDFRPSDIGCGPDVADFVIEAFSEKESSNEAATIGTTVASALHRHPFTQSGIKFSSVVVTRIMKPERSIYAWVSQISVTARVS